MSAFDLILVPTDYSEPADAALRVAAELARAFKGRLLVVHLLPLEVYGLGEYPVVSGDGARLTEEKERLRAHIGKVLEGGGTIPAHEVEVLWGSPYLHIVELAVERKTDLIVIGTHGRTGLRHVLLGSVAEKTVRLAPCPVLTVRADTAAHMEPVGRVEPSGERARMPRHGEVGRLMRYRPVTVGPNDTLEAARRQMEVARVRHLPVVDGERLVGMLSDRDLGAYLGQLAHTRVHVAMAADPRTISPEASTETAARLMLEQRVRALPVVEGERVIGILSSSDILEDYIRAARH